MFPPRKRNLALISQDEMAFNSQADTAGSDMVGFEQELIGSDRNTNGVKTKASPWPKVLGAFRGDVPNDADLARMHMRYLMPKTKFHLFNVDFDVSSNIGGYQLVFDNFGWISRSTEALDTLRAHGVDSAGTGTAYLEDVMRIISAPLLRSLYRKCMDDTSVITTSVTIDDIAGRFDATGPPLIVTGFKTTKHFTNVGLNTVVLELWDLMCVEDTNESPLELWSQDCTYINDASDMAMIDQTPNTNISRPQVGDPGFRPKKPWNNGFLQFWECKRKTRYLLRPGQTISHVVTLPSASISQKQLFGYNLNGTGMDTSAYIKNISFEILAFAIGELCFDKTTGSQNLVPSSCFLQARSEWDLSARCGPQLRGAYEVNALYDLTNSTARTAYFPTIANTNQIMIAANGAPARVENKNEDIH